ncbi:MAG: hypothetical protein HKO62_13100 [Gammaproteobacteria bacterium]|nr:hypothetical protein [Gammaproteobacteria bacterium]
MVYELDRLMGEARRLAAEYRRATGRTLPISAEIAIADVIRLLGLEAAPADAPYDAVRRSGNAVEKLQVKGRVVFDSKRGGHRLGQLRLGEDWQATLLVLMDEDYEPYKIYQASHAALNKALGDKPSGKRGSISIARFRAIGDKVWERPEAPAA